MLNTSIFNQISETTNQNTTGESNLNTNNTTVEFKEIFENKITTKDKKINTQFNTITDINTYTQLIANNNTYNNIYINTLATMILICLLLNIVFYFKTISNQTKTNTIRNYIGIFCAILGVIFGIIRLIYYNSRKISIIRLIFINNFSYINEYIK